MDVLVFRLGGQKYGLPAAQALEVCMAVAIAPLPKAPQIVEGIVDVRGTLLPVLDIRARFRVPAKALGPSDHFIIAQARDRRVAIRVDEATDLIKVSDSEFRAIDHLRGHSDYVAGVATLPDGLIIIHDLDTFLTESESRALDRASEAAS